MKPQYITRDQALYYEVASHWLSPFIWFKWGQSLMGWYIANKIRRKYKRYQRSINGAALVAILKQKE